MNKRRPLIALLCGLGLAQAARADSILEYLVAENAGKPASPQAVYVKGGMVAVKGAGGDGRLDFIYVSAPEVLFVVDHRQRKTLALDEKQIQRIARQTETVQPLLQGVGEQLAKLSPKQRAKWQEMLGEKVSLDKIAAAAAQPEPPTNIVKTGRSRKVAGIDCEQMQVFQGKRQTAEFCLADSAKLNMQEADYAALRALLSFAERLAAKTQGLAKQFGVGMPGMDLRGLAGVPIELRDAPGGKRSLTLGRVLFSEVDAKLMQPPGDYPVEPFKLWK